MGTYYTAAGEPTGRLTWAEGQAEEGGRLKERKEKEEKQYVSCNVKYTETEGALRVLACWVWGCAVRYAVPCCPLCSTAKHPAIGQS